METSGGCSARRETDVDSYVIETDVLDGQTQVQTSRP